MNNENTLTLKFGNIESITGKLITENDDKFKLFKFPKLEYIDGNTKEEVNNYFPNADLNEMDYIFNTFIIQSDEGTILFNDPC